MQTGPGLILGMAVVALGLVTLPAAARNEAVERSGIVNAGTITPLSLPVSPLPAILSADDAQAYRRVFLLQADGAWQAADQALRSIRDPILLGSVLAQRYLSKSYRPSANELEVWLAAYADFPDAQAIYALAAHKRGRQALQSLPRPVGNRLFGDSDGTRWEAEEENAYHALPERERQRIDSLKTRFRQLVATGATGAARQLLNSPVAQRLSPADTVHLQGLLSFAYFIDGRDDLALESVGRSPTRDHAVLPIAQWTAGLAAWRQQSLDRARHHFERLAQNPRASRGMIAAGAYWTARANLKTRRPEFVNHWLHIAASHPRTFYGLLARRALGLEIRLDWDTAHLTSDDTALMLESPTGRRALALIQVGQGEQAEAELRKVYLNASAAEARALVALVQQVGRPTDGSVWHRERSEAEDETTARYPVPAWHPDGGWRMDRALVLAVVRQESNFNPEARSPSGAVGLMQLLPSTASFISRNTGQCLKRKDALYQPEVNLMLGQRYLEHLLEDQDINGNLLYLIAAYNWGPRNLTRWVRKTRLQDDPLLFMESLPQAETRLFVERVLTNFWMYRVRLNQPTPSLDTLASGDWPLYVQLDPHNPMVAENVPY
ncbi:MAG: soluble lytic murein transglycosylase and related regulatory protein [Rhodospirillaceae bacterium]|nr:MAG: soluble lytic murein transglycosylase and related regulatory protein [Rhodospirillaceae bacterium]